MRHPDCARPCFGGLGLLAALLALGAAGCAGGDDDLLTVLLKGPKVRVENNSFLELSVVGPLPDKPSSSPFAQFGGQGSGSMWDLRRGLLAAAEDDRVVGLKLEIESPGMGFGAMDELSDLLDTFRGSGKPIHVYLRNDFVDDGAYYLALAGDRITVAPATALMVNGLRAEVTFWRGTLEKLGIVPHVLMFKEYKSAGEPLARESMSEAFRESLTAVLSDLEERIHARISSRRGLPPVQVRAGMDRGLLTTTEAMQTGWVDASGYREDIERALAKSAKIKTYQGITFKKYLRSVDRGKPGMGAFDLGALGGAKKPAIALVFGEGPIVAAESGDPFEGLLGGESVIHGLTVARAIDEASEEPEVRAIVFRVDSPGGSAVGSDHIRDAVRRARERGKKVVVSMATVAGSGGYWIAMGADKIVAQPSTITGSIGVVMTSFDVRGFYQWIGAHVDTVSLSKNSGMFSGVEDFDTAREERWTAWMSAVYEDFKGHVAKGRKLSPQRVEEIAKGRIWSGSDALERGLVDQLGGLSEAIETACLLGGIDDPASVEIQIYPKKNELEEMFSTFFDGVSAPSAAETAMRALDPETVRQLARPRVLVLVPHIRID